MSEDNNVPDAMTGGHTHRPRKQTKFERDKAHGDGLRPAVTKSVDELAADMGRRLAAGALRRLAKMTGDEVVRACQSERPGDWPDRLAKALLLVAAEEDLPSQYMHPTLKAACAAAKRAGKRD